MAGEGDGSGAEGRLSREQLLTDPEQAADFVAATRVDALAIAIRTSHGAQAPKIRPVPLEEMARRYPGKAAAVSWRVPGASTRT